MKKIIEFFESRCLSKKYGFPRVKKDYYLYCAGLDLGYVRFKKWVEYRKKHNLEKKNEYALVNKDNFIGVYRLMKYYKENGGSDLAYGDSGCSGNLVLCRVDKI